MKTNPILFNEEMVRAILDGRKTQTRRVIKEDFYVENDPPLTPYAPDYLTGEPNPVVLPCPYGQVGDRLWVRKAWAYCFFRECFIYRADGFSENEKIKWKPSIHIPREASRITLEITGVRVERLQDTSEEDAIAEGIECEVYDGDKPVSACWFDYQEKLFSGAFDSPIDSFKTLWDSINAKNHPWEANPWVWAIDFKRVTDEN